MFEYVWAIVALLSWSLSTFFINKALYYTRDDIKNLTIGILISLFSGSIISLVYFNLTDNSLYFNIIHIIIGFIVFVVANFLYYYSSYLFKGKSEIPAQLSNSKNIISASFGILLGESLTSGKLIAVILLILGISIIIFSTLIDNELDYRPIIAGLSLALVWSFGEILIAIFATGNVDPIEMSVSGLIYSTIIYFFILVCFFYYKNYNLKGIVSISTKNHYLYFVSHGLLSFSVGYTMFYKSVYIVGLSETIIITSLWPIVAILSFSIISLLKGEKIEYNWKAYFISGLFIFIGSLMIIIPNL